MIDSWPILSIVTFLPMAGVLFLLMIKGDDSRVADNARQVALWVSGFTFLLSLPLWVMFDSSFAGYQFEEKAVWLQGTGIGYHMG
ncbi:MAG: NADH-quinone oxidoreductase subunit M, partial [Candidatus Puniceispirillum sp.]